LSSKRRIRREHLLQPERYEVLRLRRISGKTGERPNFQGERSMSVGERSMSVGERSISIGERGKNSGAGAASAASPAKF
jgi:hypothetical protein